MDKKRPFVGVHFKCCNVYSRIYLNKDGTAYEGMCPRCYRKKVELKVSPTGSKSRFYDAT